jgi:hypothetical protein
MSAAGILDAALELAAAGWRVFPLRGKAPAIAKEAGGNGVLDATTDPATITAWWTGRYRRCKIGARVPDLLVVIDIDPRHGGHLTLAELEDEHGPPTRNPHRAVRPRRRRPTPALPPPARPLSASRLGAGIDVKTSAGYCVVPPSTHPDTGQP